MPVRIRYRSDVCDLAGFMASAACGYDAFPGAKSVWEKLLA
jgi:hypothetical protein